MIPFLKFKSFETQADGQTDTESFEKQIFAYTERINKNKNH